MRKPQRIEDRFIAWYMQTHASKAELRKWGEVVEELLTAFYDVVSGYTSHKYCYQVAEKFFELDRNNKIQWG